MFIEAALKFNVAPAFLEFIGTTDARCVGKGVLYMFNILDPQHERYESTVAITKEIEDAD